MDKIIEIKDMYECPFKGRFEVKLSDDTSNFDDTCVITERYEDDCSRENCPLIKNGKILVKWIGV